VGGGLCRQHAIVLELELEQASVTERVIGIIDRKASRSSGDPLLDMIAKAVGGVLGGIFASDQRAAEERRRRAGLPPRPSQPPPPFPGAGTSHPPPNSPPRPPDPQRQALRAREILGFEPTEALTTEKVQKRKQALARVFHPDMQGGSEAQMKRINLAADVLLARLS
jgi:hypothetical protein